MAYTAEQRDNLEKLAAFLDGLPNDYEHFKMDAYVGAYGRYNDLEEEFDISEADEERLRNCGTCACAVGHGPLAGINPKYGENWQTYEKRVFGVGQRDQDWDYMFGPENIDDAKAAATRIREVLSR